MYVLLCRTFFTVRCLNASSLFSSLCRSATAGKRARALVLRLERHGISFSKLYDKCRSKCWSVITSAVPFLFGHRSHKHSFFCSTPQVTSDLSLRNYLREFTDHQLVAKRAAGGATAEGSAAAASSSSGGSGGGRGGKHVYVVTLSEEVINTVILSDKNRK